MKRQHTKIALMVSVLTVSIGCSRADLRSDEWAPSEPSAAAGRALLGEMAAAHGGAANFRRAGVYRATISDDWRPTGFPFTLLKPFPEKVQRYELYQPAGSEDGRMAFLNGKLKGTEWGVQNWETYTIEDGGEPRFKDNDTIRFTVPAIGYFIQAPFRLQEADVVHRIEPAVYDGKRYERVFVSWGTAAPQKRVDQFVAWIDPDTSRLAFLDWTARQQAKFAKGMMAFDDYREVGGLWISHKMTTLEEPGGKPQFHIVNVEKIDFSTDTEAAFLAPRPDRARPKFL